MKNTYQLRQWHFFEMKGSYFIFVANDLRLYAVNKEAFGCMEEMQKKYGFHNSFELEDDEEDSIISELIEDELAVCVKNNQSNINNEDIDFDNKFDIHCYEPASKLIVSNIILQLANDCNLNCLYCYGDGGSFGRKRELMDFEIAKKGIDLMVSNCGDLNELHITFFGGEPLINFTVIKQIVQYCKHVEEETDKKFTYSMTTNGTILNDEIFNFIKDNKISVMISMDGDQDIQDSYRCYENGKGSYDDIIRNIPKFKEARGGYLPVRSTICKPNCNLKKIKDDLANLGFNRVNMAIVDTRRESPLFVGEDCDETLLQNYMILADEYIECIKKGQQCSFRIFEDILKNLYFKKLKVQSCNAGKNGFALGTDKNIYPCQRFMGMEDYIVGNLQDGIDIDKTNYYRKVNVLMKEDCINCWARFLCGGACTHTCATQEQDIMKAPKCYCNLYKGIFEIALYIYNTLKNWDDDVFNNLFKQQEDKSAV